MITSFQVFFLSEKGKNEKVIFFDKSFYLRKSFGNERKLARKAIARLDNNTK